MCKGRFARIVESNNFSNPYESQHPQVSPKTPDTNDRLFKDDAHAIESAIMVQYRSLGAETL